MKINLIYKQEKYRKIEKKFKIIRYTIIFVGIVAFITVAILFFLTFSQNAIYSELTSQKSVYLRNATQNQEKEKKVHLLDKKGALIKEGMQNELQFASYYQILDPFLQFESTSSSEVDSLAVDKDGEITFSKNFYSFSDLLANLSIFESQSFIDLFETAGIEDMSLNSQSSNQYSLTFSGQIKPAKELE